MTHIDMDKLLRVVCLITFFVSLTPPTHAQISPQGYRIDYDNGLLTLSAKEANLANLLANIAEKTGILVNFPENLGKQTTINLSGIPLGNALRRLLKGENYAIIYKGSTIREVYILPKPSGPRIPTRSTPRRQDREERLRASISKYEKRLETLKGRMATVDEGSTRGRSIGNQIRSMERTIERLYKSLER